MCGRTFPRYRIDAHVNICLDVRDSTSSAASLPRTPHDPDVKRLRTERTLHNRVSLANSIAAASRNNGDRSIYSCGGCQGKLYVGVVRADRSGYAGSTRAAISNSSTSGAAGGEYDFKVSVDDDERVATAAFSSSGCAKAHWHGVFDVQDYHGDSHIQLQLSERRHGRPKSTTIQVGRAGLAMADTVSSHSKPSLPQKQCDIRSSRAAAVDESLESRLARLLGYESPASIGAPGSVASTAALHHHKQVLYHRHGHLTRADDPLTLRLAVDGQGVIISIKSDVVKPAAVVDAGGWLGIRKHELRFIVPSPGGAASGSGPAAGPLVHPPAMLQPPWARQPLPHFRPFTWWRRICSCFCGIAGAVANGDGRDALSRARGGVAANSRASAASGRNDINDDDQHELDLKLARVLQASLDHYHSIRKRSQQQPSLPPPDVITVHVEVLYVPLADVTGPSLPHGCCVPSMTPLHRAAADGHVPLFKALVTACGKEWLLRRTDVHPLAITAAASDGSSAGVLDVVNLSLGHLSVLDVALLCRQHDIVALICGLIPPSPRLSIGGGLHSLHYAVMAGQAPALKLVCDSMVRADNAGSSSDDERLARLGRLAGRLGRADIATMLAMLRGHGDADDDEDDGTVAPAASHHGVLGNPSSGLYRPGSVSAMVAEWVEEASPAHRPRHAEGSPGHASTVRPSSGAIVASVPLLASSRPPPLYRAAASRRLVDLPGRRPAATTNAGNRSPAVAANIAALSTLSSREGRHQAADQDNSGQQDNTLAVSIPREPSSPSGIITIHPSFSPSSSLSEPVLPGGAPHAVVVVTPITGTVVSTGTSAAVTTSDSIGVHDVVVGDLGGAGDGAGGDDDDERKVPDDADDFQLIDQASEGDAANSSSLVPAQPPPPAAALPSFVPPQPSSTPETRSSRDGIDSGLHQRALPLPPPVSPPPLLVTLPTITHPRLVALIQPLVDAVNSRRSPSHQPQSSVSVSGGAAGPASGLPAQPPPSILDEARSACIIASHRQGYPGSLDCLDAGGRSPLMTATLMGDLSCVETLVRNGAAPGCPDSQGRTSLMHACRVGRADIALFLLLRVHVPPLVYTGAPSCDASMSSAAGGTGGPARPEPSPSSSPVASSPSAPPPTTPPQPTTPAAATTAATSAATAFPLFGHRYGLRRSRSRIRSSRLMHVVPPAARSAASTDVRMQQLQQISKSGGGTNGASSLVPQAGDQSPGTAVSVSALPPFCSRLVSVVPVLSQSIVTFAAGADVIDPAMPALSSYAPAAACDDARSVTIRVAPPGLPCLTMIPAELRKHMAIARPSVAGNDGVTALMLAVEAAGTECPLSTVDGAGDTASSCTGLSSSTRACMLDVVRLLVEAGADRTATRSVNHVNQQPLHPFLHRYLYPRHESPLHMAAASGHLCLVRVLTLTDADETYASVMRLPLPAGGDDDDGEGVVERLIAAALVSTGTGEGDDVDALTRSSATLAATSAAVATASEALVRLAATAPVPSADDEGDGGGSAVSSGARADTATRTAAVTTTLLRDLCVATGVIPPMVTYQTPPLAPTPDHGAPMHQQGGREYTGAAIELMTSSATSDVVNVPLTADIDADLALALRLSLAEVSAATAASPALAVAVAAAPAASATTAASALPASTPHTTPSTLSIASSVGSSSSVRSGNVNKRASTFGDDGRGHIFDRYTSRTTVHRARRGVSVLGSAEPGFEIDNDGDSDQDSDETGLEERSMRASPLDVAIAAAAAEAAHRPSPQGSIGGVASSSCGRVTDVCSSGGAEGTCACSRPHPSPRVLVARLLFRLAVLEEASTAIERAAQPSRVRLLTMANYVHHGHVVGSMLASC